MNDLTEELTGRKLSAIDKKREATLLFDPTGWNDDKDILTMMNHQLTSEELVKYAELATRIRLKLHERAVFKKHGERVFIKPVIKILKNNFSMTCRKLRRIPYPGNFEHNKVLRSFYAQTILKLYDSDTRIVNIDETTLI